MDDRAPADGIAASSTFTERHPAIPLVLSFCSAFVDVTCFVGLFSTFTAFITGSIIVLCSELYHASGQPWIRLTVLGTFFVGVVASFAAMRWLRRSNWPAIKVCLAAEAVFILLFLIAAIALPPRDNLFNAGTTLAVVLAALAMSLQNTLMVVLMPFHKPTTIMTGNFVRLVVRATEQISGNRDGDKPGSAPEHPTDTHWVLLAFVTGGITGGACITFIGFWGLIIPAAALAAISALLPSRPG